jgi:hypothetical protein
MPLKKYFILLIFSLPAITCVAQFVGLNPKEITTLKELVQNNPDVNKLLVKIQHTADEALHNNPDPRDTIISEGHLNNHPDKIASERSMKDYHKIYSLALVYKIKGEDSYRKKAIEYLKAWASVNHPQGNPINDTKFDELFEGYDMLRTGLSSEDRNIIDTWINTIAQLEIRSLKKGKATSFTNWHSHRLKLVGQVGFILNNEEYIKYATEGLRTQINVNLNSDGTSWDFLERDALHYHAYDLEPMLYLAIIIKRATGSDDFSYVSPNQSSIKKSVDWFLPYVTGKKTHQEFTNSKVAFDAARAKNNEKGYAAGSLFDPGNGIYVISLAAYFDRTYSNALEKGTAGKTEFPNWQIVLNNIRLGN